MGTGGVIQADCWALLVHNGFCFSGMIVKSELIGLFSCSGDFNI